MKIRLLVMMVGLLLVGCEATMQQAIPTERPTITATYTPSATRTPNANGSPTITATIIPATATDGPSPTPLFGAENTSVAQVPTPTVISNPNAPRIEYFTTDSLLGVAPGSTLTLFWSTRGANTAAIYRLDSSGERTQLWNVEPEGSLAIATRNTDRGMLEFVLTVGEGAIASEARLSVPLACPDVWFFAPAPDACPTAPAQPTPLIEQVFERGRMLFMEQENLVYVLFNDGQAPAWIRFENRYDATIHPESAENFTPPVGFYQPLAILGYVWRGNDTVRNRTGLGIQPEAAYEGFIQTAPSAGEENIYISSVDGSVLQLLPEGESWQIIAAPAP